MNDHTEHEQTRLLNTINENENELFPYVKGPLKSMPMIYRCLTISHKKQSSCILGQQVTTESTSQETETETSSNDKLGNLLPRFGPMYRQQPDPMLFAKKKAWQHVKYSMLGEDGRETKEKILIGIRRVEKEAREAYSENFMDTRSEFRMMMIRDGCLFLQMAFMILGKSHLELGYLLDDPVFGGKAILNSISGWMEAMFNVGNQIPLVILKELIKQRKFQDLIRTGNWNPPTSDLRKRMLYEQLVLPELMKTKNVVGYGVEEKPCDVLYVLRNLVIGQPSNSSTDYVFEEFDLEANNDDDVDDDDEMKFSSALQMKQVGIHIEKLQNGGPKNIYFKSYYFCARLYLPVLPVDANIIPVFRSLKSYEISNKQLGNRNQEVCSYISLMSNIIQTPQDLILLQKKGIIVGDSDYAEKLPGILRKLNSKDVKVTYNLSNVRRQMTNFSSPLVRYQTILNLVFILTLLQAFFAVLAYFKPPKG